jgi:hypothetical protein
MKGISRFIDYSLILLSSFVVMTLFTILIYGYYNDVLKTNIQVSLKQIAAQTSDSILNLYDQVKESDTNPKNSSSVILSSIDLKYPNQVSGRNFEVELVSSPGIWNQITNITVNDVNATIVKETSSGAKIIAKTRQSPIVSYEYDVPNVPIKLQGKYTSGDNDTLSLVRYNYNGTIEDVIILGNSTIIVGITSIN